MATVADSPSAKQPREKSVVMLKTLVMAAGDGWELGCQAAADGSVTDSKTSATGEALQCCAVCSSAVPAGSHAECLLETNICCLRYSGAAFASAGHAGHCGLAGPATLQPLTLLRESPVPVGWRLPPQE